MSVIEQSEWPRELWWCENPACNEPSASDPCDFCGEPIRRHKVVPAEQLEGVVERAERAEREAAAYRRIIEQSNMYDTWLADYDARRAGGR